MARGWESKDVESQMEEPRRGQRPLPAADPAALTAARERDRLLLDRTRLLADLQRACHPRHRGQIEAALRHVDDQLAALR